MKEIKAKSVPTQVSGLDTDIKAPESQNRIIDILDNILRVITGRKKEKSKTKAEVKTATPKSVSTPKVAPARKPPKDKAISTQTKVLKSEPQPALKMVASKPVKAVDPLDNVKIEVVSPVKKEPVKKAVESEVKAAPAKGANGRFISNGSAEEAQKAKRERKERREEQSALRNTMDDVADATALGSALATDAIDSSAANAVGTSVAGGDWVAAKRAFDGVRELKTGLAGGISKVSEVKEKWIGRKESEPESESDNKKENDGKKSGFLNFGKMFKKLHLKDWKWKKKADKELVETVKDQTEDLDKTSKLGSKALVKAIEDNAGGGSSSGGMFDGTKKKLSGFLPALSKFVKVAGGPLAGILAGGAKYMDVKDDETLSGGQKAVQVGTTGGGALSGALAGGAAGAAIGSFIPVIGTAIGGIVGAAIGGVAGGMAGEAIGEVISDNMDGPVTEAKQEIKGDAEKVNEVIATPSKDREVNNKAATVKSTYATAQEIESPKPVMLKPLEVPKTPLNRIDQRTGLPLKNPTNSALDGKEISDPIVKAINQLMKKNSGSRDAYKNNPIPMEFDTELLALMAHDKI